MLNQEKIGRFIAEIRKEKNMTQKELAEKLGISDKAVSKWENGRSMPDNSLLMELCELLDINVNELLSGEKLSDNSYHGKAEENMVKLIEQSENEKKKNKNVFISLLFGGIALIGLLFGVMWISAGNLEWYLDCPTIIIIVVITFIVLLMSGLAKDFVTSFLIAFGMKQLVEKSELRKALAAQKLVITVVPMIGIIATIVGVISIFGQLTDMKIIVTNLSVAMLSILYSFIIDLLLLPIAAKLWAMDKNSIHSGERL